MHVGSDIVKKCMMEYLNKETRLIITHALNYCKYFDYIYLMKEGSIIEHGTYKDVSRSLIYKKMVQK